MKWIELYVPHSVDAAFTSGPLYFRCFGRGSNEYNRVFSTRESNAILLALILEAIVRSLEAIENATTSRNLGHLMSLGHSGRRVHWLMNCE